MGALQLTVTFNKRGLEEKLRRLEEAIASSDEVVERVALNSLRRVVDATPRRYTGDTAKQWVHRAIGACKHVIANPSKVMFWLEHGTKAHGPKKAKALFIPLNRKTWEAGSREVMEANARAAAAGAWKNYTARAAGKKGRKIRLPFVLGVDFVLAKRVKGIKPHRIAAKEQVVVARELRQRLSEHLKQAMK